MSYNMPSTRSIADLIDDVNDRKLIIRPIFQRRQVWNNADKERFIETILKGYPFPEIFVAVGSENEYANRRHKVLVDGQQRVSTILSYVQKPEDLLYKQIPRHADLTQIEKNGFNDYRVAVRELGTASNAVVKEIFHRINSTDYALKSMEILNAMYDGEYKKFCEQLSGDDFFVRHNVFNKAYTKRMRDVSFCVILVTTLLSGYYKRDERNQEYLERYNEDFPQADEIRVGLDRIFDFVERCQFPGNSRAWKTTDLFTLLVEIHTAFQKNPILDPIVLGPRILSFLDEVDELFKGDQLPDEKIVPAESRMVRAYLKASTKATNDKYARVERAKIIADLLTEDNAESDKQYKRPRKPKK